MSDLARLADAAERIASALELLAAQDQPAADAAIARLVAAIHQAAADEPLRAAEIIELADSPLSTRAALRVALAGRTAKSLGKLLAAHVGIGIEGLTIKREPGRRWRVCAFQREQKRNGFNPWRI
jgi:hypothetical protein